MVCGWLVDLPFFLGAKMIEKLTRASMSTILNKVNEVVDEVNALLSLEGERVKAREIVSKDYPIVPGDETSCVFEQEILAEIKAEKDEPFVIEHDWISENDALDSTDVVADENDPSATWNIKHRGFGKWDVITPEGNRFNENGISKDEAQALVQAMDRKVA